VPPCTYRCAARLLGGTGSGQLVAGIVMVGPRAVRVCMLPHTSAVVITPTVLHSSQRQYPGISLPPACSAVHAAL
jgi:hypothetical protein